MIRLLHVEDSDDDALLVTLALDEAAPGWRQRIHYQRARTAYEAAKMAAEHRPNLLLLDLNLRDHAGGHELLEQLKESPATGAIPVVVLSSSDSQDDIVAAYAAHAAAYLVKPPTFRSLHEMMEHLERFWLKQAKLP